MAGLGDGRRGNSMVEKRRGKSRREVIRAVAKGVPAGLLLRISQTEASEKMTRQQAEYQDAPKDIYSCGMCTLFEPPKYCKVVAGEVSRDGWLAGVAIAAAQNAADLAAAGRPPGIFSDGFVAARNSARQRS
jgi:hypothetical protein